MDNIDNDEFEAANQRGAELAQAAPRAVSAYFDEATARIVIAFSNESRFEFPARIAQGLEKAKAAQLKAIELSPSGLGLHIPALDVDLYIPALLAGVFGSASWTAARLGKAGGAARSEAKAAASRENGKKGGRPRKAVAHQP